MVSAGDQALQLELASVDATWVEATTPVEAVAVLVMVLDTIIVLESVAVLVSVLSDSHADQVSVLGSVLPPSMG